MQKTSNKLSNPLCLTLWSWLRFHLQFFLQQSGWLYSCKKSQQFQFPSETEANSAQKWVIFEAWWKPDVHDQRDAPHIVQPHPSPQAACFTTARCVTNCGRKDRRSQWLQKKKKGVQCQPWIPKPESCDWITLFRGLFNYSRIVLITLKEWPIYVPRVADPDWTIQNQNISQMIPPIPPPLRSSHRRMPLLRRFASWQMSRQNSGTIMFCVHDHGIDLQNCDCLSQSCQIWMTAYSVFHVVFESINLCRIDSLVERKWSCCMLDVPWSRWNCRDLNIMNSNKYQARSLRCLHCAMAKEPTVLIVFWCKTLEARGKVRKLAGLL